MKINDVTSSGPLVLHPVPISYGEDVHLHYKGFLAQEQNNEIYAHIGYGNNNSWQYITDMKMNRSGNEYVAKIHVDNDSRLNICFKGSNNQWDNNYGNNWSFEIHNGAPNIF